MKSPTPKGDKLENGGEVAGGSDWTEFMSRRLARKDDAAVCDEHGAIFIDEGYARFPDRDRLPSLPLRVRLPPDLVAPER